MTYRTSSKVLSSSCMLFMFRSSPLWLSCITWFSNVWFCFTIVESWSSSSAIILSCLLHCALVSLIIKLVWFFSLINVNHLPELSHELSNLLHTIISLINRWNRFVVERLRRIGRWRRWRLGSNLRDHSGKTYANQTESKSTTWLPCSRLETGEVWSFPSWTTAERNVTTSFWVLFLLVPTSLLRLVFFLSTSICNLKNYTLIIGWSFWPITNYWISILVD